MNDTPTDQTDQTDEYEPFLAALHKAIRPEVLDRAAEQLAEVVAAVKREGKKGRLALTIDLVPMTNVPDAVEVTTRLKASPPEPPLRATPMWPDEDGRLHRNDPRQQRLPFGVRTINDDQEHAQ